MITQHARHAAFRLLLVLFGGLCASFAAAAPSPVADVINKTGAVTVQRYGGPLNALNYKDTLSLGDIVRTGPNGSATIEFADGSHFAMRAGSAVRIGTTAPAARRRNIIEVFLGAVLAHLRPSETIGTAVPTTYIAARGTDVLVEVTADTTTTLTVTEGDAVLTTAQGSQEVPQSEQSRALPGQAPTPPYVVDTTGLIAWTADAVSLPLEFELPPLTPGPNGTPDYPQLVATFTAATQATPGDAAAWDNLGEADRAVGDIPAALNAFQQAQALDPNNANALVGIALVRLSQGRIDDARAALAPVQGQALPTAVLGLADLHAGAPDDAAAAFQSALAQDPTLYTARALLALADLTQDDLPGAETAARAAARQQPNSAQTQGILAMTLFFAGQTHEAEADARRAVRIDPQSPFALLTEGRTLMAQGQTEAAHVAYEKAAAAAPHLWLAHEELGAVYLRLDMPHQAAEEYQIAIRENPQSPSAAASYAGLGAVLAAQRKFTDALAADRTAIGLDPANVAAHYNLATALIEEGHLDEARRELETGLAADPGRGVLYARLAEISLYQQNLAAAQDFAQRAVHLLPNSSFTHYELGRVYLEQQRTVQAEQEFRYATLLDPDDADSRYALGLTEQQTESLLVNSFNTAPTSALVGSPGSSDELENLETPGANNRLQAALEDPTSVRVASRSFGNTEVDLQEAQNDTYDASESFLDLTHDGRGVFGVNAEEDHANGVRANADTKGDIGSLVFGEKASNSPNDIFVLADDQLINNGEDTGLQSDPNLATYRDQTSLPRLVAGFQALTGSHGRLRALAQISTATEDDFDDSTTGNYLRDNIHSLDGEVRWDVSINRQNTLNTGFSYGSRSRKFDNDSTFAGFGSDELLFTFTEKPAQGYVRDTLATGRLTLIGQMQVVGLETTEGSNDLQDSSGVLQPSTSASQYTTVGLPTAIVTYQADARNIFRVRARRAFGSVTDFDLLTPTDVFLISYTGLPQANYVSPVADGWGVDGEYDYTFANASFLSIGAFQQQLNQADVTAANNDPVAQLGPYAKAQLQGVEANYQGLFSKNLSYLANGTLDRAEDTDMHMRIAQVPNYYGQVSLQYLDHKGIYAQGLYYFQGDRVYEDFLPNPDPTAPLQPDATRQGGFGLVNLRVGKRWGLRANVYFEVNNLFNRQYDTYSNLQDGRTVGVGTSLRF